MMTLAQRLDLVERDVSSAGLLVAEGLGKEIPYWIFEYNPADELQVRAFVTGLTDRANRAGNVSVAHIDVLQIVQDMLRQRGFLEKTIEMQRTRGDVAVAKAISSATDARHVARWMVDKSDLEQSQIVLVDGIGAAYPMIRAHALMNNLQPLTGETPFVFFYPGTFDGTAFNLFGEFSEEFHNSYYRGLRLHPPETSQT